MKKPKVILLSETEGSDTGVRGVATVHHDAEGAKLRISVINAPAEKTIVAIADPDIKFHPFYEGFSVPVTEGNDLGIALLSEKDEKITTLLYGNSGRTAPGAKEMRDDYEKACSRHGNADDSETEETFSPDETKKDNEMIAAAKTPDDNAASEDDDVTDNVPPGKANDAEIPKAAFSEGSNNGDHIEKDAYKPINEPYDDEIVATENYFAFTETTEKEITDDGNRKMESRDPDDLYREKTKEDRNFESDPPDGVEPTAFHGDYYERIRGELEKTFTAFPEERELTNMIPNSKWVRIPFDENKYYVVGVLYEKEIPSYLCYGVPGKYGKRPEELERFCTFIPSSPFCLKNDGYWVLYQDAKTGICIKPQ